MTAFVVCFLYRQKRKKAAPGSSTVNSRPACTINSLYFRITRERPLKDRTPSAIKCKERIRTANCREYAFLMNSKSSRRIPVIIDRAGIKGRI